MLNLRADVTLRVLLAAAVLSGGARTAAAQELAFGAKAGPSFGMLAFDPEDGGGYDRRVAADGGAFLVLPLARRLAVQFEALFTSKGAKLYDPELDATGGIILQHFDTPVLLRLQGPSSRSGSFHVFAGPYSGIRLSAKREITQSGGFGRAGVKEDMPGEIERFEFGVVAGAGVDIGERLTIDGRYSRGLTPLNTDRSEGVRIRSRGISIMAGVRF